MARKFTNEEKGRARRLRSEGRKIDEIAKTMARSLAGVWIHVADVKKGSAVSDPWTPRPDRLQRLSESGSPSASASVGVSP